MASIYTVITSWAWYDTVNTLAWILEWVEVGQFLKLNFSKFAFFIRISLNIVRVSWKLNTGKTEEEHHSYGSVVAESHNNALVLFFSCFDWRASFHGHFQMNSFDEYLLIECLCLIYTYSYYSLILRLLDNQYTVIFWLNCSVNVPRRKLTSFFASNLSLKLFWAHLS